MGVKLRLRERSSVRGVRAGELIVFLTEADFTGQAKTMVRSDAIGYYAATLNLVPADTGGVGVCGAEEELAHTAALHTRGDAEGAGKVLTWFLRCYDRHMQGAEAGGAIRSGAGVGGVLSAFRNRTEEHMARAFGSIMLVTHK